MTVIAMLSAQTLRERLERYATGNLSREALEDWLASETWDMRRWAPKGLQRLIEALQAAFIANHDERLPDEELHSMLLQKLAQLRESAARSIPSDEIVTAIKQKPAISVEWTDSPESQTEHPSLVTV